MRVTHLHATNFRSIDDLQLDLSEDGMIALVGPPGSGKSSLTAIIPFVLYGDTGQNGSLVDLRRRGSDDKQRCGGTVTFTRGQDIIVASRWLTRTTPRGKVKETAHASLTINGETFDGITPTKLTEEMTRLLGMPRDAFRGAAFIGQGEVDILATATPTEVQKLVEHHTGLASLTKERDRLRTAARDAVNAANALPGSLDEVERTAEDRDDAAATVATARNIADTAHTKAAHTKEQLTNAQNRANELYKAEQDAKSSRDGVVAAEAIAARADQTAQKVAGELAASDIDPDTDLDALRRDKDMLAAASQSLIEAGSSYKHHRSAADDAASAVERAQAAVSAIDSESLSGRRADIEATIDSATKNERNAADTRAAYVAEAKRYRRSIEQLTATDEGAACCPTCRQQLADIEGLIAEFTEAATGADEQADAADATVRQHTNELADAKRKLDELRQIEQKNQAAVRELERATLALDSSKNRVTAAAEALRSAIRDTNQQVDDDSAGDALLSAGREAAKAVSERLSSIDATGRAVSDYRSATAAAESAHRDVEGARSAVKDAPASGDIETARAEVTRLQEDFDADSSEANDALRHVSAAEVTLAQLQTTADAEENRWKAKKKALSDAEVATGVANVVGALRSELLAEFTGQISAAASELLAQFGGEHTAFHLDSDFVPRLELADGTRVETKTLSGGEKARAGLAFRLGITLHITRGGVPDQVVGDEVTNYLDEEGRRAVITALQHQFPSVLLISHTPEALDLAASVVPLNRAPLGATVVGEDDTSLDSSLPEAS